MLTKNNYYSRNCGIEFHGAPQSKEESSCFLSLCYKLREVITTKISTDHPVQLSIFRLGAAPCLGHRIKPRQHSGGRGWGPDQWAANLLENTHLSPEIPTPVKLTPVCSSRNLTNVNFHKCKLFTIVNFLNTFAM